MDNIVKFDKPYKFEGKEYDSLDLSGMEKMTVQDLIDIQKNIGNELAAMSVMEMTTSFAQEMAVKATGKPVEFFKLMPRGKIKKVQAAVVKGMDNSENADEVKKQLESHTLKFAAPYTYEGSEKAELKGKTFDGIDLSGVGELNTMSESMAENRMAAGGYTKDQTDQNISTAVDAHNSADTAHGDIRASVAAMRGSINAIELKFGTNVTKNPFSATFSSLDGLTVTGVWNAEQARVEF